MREKKAFGEITGAMDNRGAGYGLEVPCVYRLYGPNVYVDKLRSWLSLYLLMDIIICVIVTLLNDNWCFLINGCGRWLFLEVNSYCFYSLV